MNKTKAGERKRTVTVVIGPKTEWYLTKVAGVTEASRPGLRLSHTHMVGMALNVWMVSMQAALPADSGKAPVSHFE